jgi:hypothetical protein
VVVVSDTSPLTALLTIGQAELVRDLFDRVIVPPAVRSELLREHAILPAWLDTVTPKGIPAEVIEAQLDSGEAEAIALALELQADALLIDERLGRQVATRLGIRPIGVLGCLVLAKRRGQISSLSALIEQLRSQAGCWFDDELIASVRRAADEE